MSTETIKIGDRTYDRAAYEARERTRPISCGDGCGCDFGCRHDHAHPVRDLTCDWCGGLGQTQQGTGSRHEPFYEWVRCGKCRGTGAS